MVARVNFFLFCYKHHYHHYSFIHYFDTDELLFHELLELVELDLRPLGDPTSCPTFHLMPRFVRSLPGASTVKCLPYNFHTQPSRLLFLVGSTLVSVPLLLLLLIALTRESVCRQFSNNLSFLKIFVNMNANCL